MLSQGAEFVFELGGGVGDDGDWMKADTAELLALFDRDIGSTGVTDNAQVLRPVIEELQVPYITRAGTTRFVGEYCFSLANGGHGEEAAILAAYRSSTTCRG